jgi:hypothetical protein
LKNNNQTHDYSGAQKLIFDTITVLVINIFQLLIQAEKLYGLKSNGNIALDL